MRIADCLNIMMILHRSTSNNRSWWSNYMSGVIGTLQGSALAGEGRGLASLFHPQVFRDDQ
jgi:hypothetical protein